MDLVTVSAGLVALLAPLLPYLTSMGKAAGDAALDRLGQAIGRSAARRTVALWNRLWPSLHARRSAREATAEVVAAPDARKARASLAREVAVLLEGDPELAEEAQALLGVVRGQGVDIDVDRISVVGDRNVTQFGAFNISIGEAEEVHLEHPAGP